MSREYTNREVAKIIEDSEETEIRLVPRLMLKNGSASLEFKLGRDRFYIIKDLLAFAEAVRTGASVSYGKQLTFHHSLNAFAQGRLSSERQVDGNGSTRRGTGKARRCRSLG